MGKRNKLPVVKSPSTGCVEKVEIKEGRMPLRGGRVEWKHVVH